MHRFYSPDHFYHLQSSFDYLSPYHLKSPSNLKSVKSQISLNPIKTSNLHYDYKKIGKYQYKSNDLIGQGYSSKVYKAENIQENKIYAIKVIDLKKMSSTSIQMLENQISILKTLDHPNIIKCYDIYKSKANCYIVTEYCSGGTMMDKISQKNIKITENQAIEWIKQVIEGVKYLHQKGIIHRDLKPANILKTKTSWKIADFGFAILGKTQIKTKVNVGTPLYMPLQSLLHNIYSPESDIFSIGIILYELINGITPWQSKNQKTLIKKMQSVPFQTLLSSISNIQLKQILKNMCNKNKNQRVLNQDLFKFDKLDKQKIITLNIMNPEKQNQLQQKNIIQKNHEKQIIHRNKSVDYYTKINHKLQKNKSFQYISERINKNPLLNSLKKSHLIHNNIKIDKFISYPKLNPPTLKLIKKSQLPFQNNQNKPEQINPEVSKQQNTISTHSSGQQIKHSHKNLKSIFIENNHIIINQIHFCRFLYYFHLNLDYVLLQRKSKQKLIQMIIHSLKKLINELNELNIKNTFNLQNWQEYIKTQKFQQINKTIKQYTDRYQKDLNNLIINKNKNNQQNNQQYAQIQQEQILRVTKSLLIECNENLKLTINSIQVSSRLKGSTSVNPSKFILSNIEGLKNLYEFFRLIKLSKQCQKKPLQFEQKSKIKVNKDYRKNITVTFQDHYQLDLIIKKF